MKDRFTSREIHVRPGPPKTRRCLYVRGASVGFVRVSVLSHATTGWLGEAWRHLGDDERNVDGIGEGRDRLKAEEDGEDLVRPTEREP